MKTLLYMETKKLKRQMLFILIMAVMIIYFTMKNGLTSSSFYPMYFTVQFMIQTSTNADISRCLPISLKARYAYHVAASFVTAIGFGFIALIMMWLLKSKTEMIFHIVFMSYFAFLFMLVFRSMTGSSVRSRGAVLTFNISASILIVVMFLIIKNHFYLPMEQYVYSSIVCTVMVSIMLVINYNIERYCGYEYKKKLT